MAIVIFLTTLVCNSGITFIDAIAFNIITVVAFAISNVVFAQQNQVHDTIRVLTPDYIHIYSQL